MLLKTYKNIFISLFSVFILFNNVSAQQNPASALKHLYDNYPHEKIYLWYNKAEYLAGETIWFKAYVFSGYDVSYISTSLHVEIYDISGKIINTKLLPLSGGVTEGSIEIDSKLSEGVYFVRAYTTWMLNFDARYQYIKPILIHNASSAQKLNMNKSLWKAEAHPEGGSLVSGLETKIAIRRLATASLNSKWGGYIYEASTPNVKLIEFTSLDQNIALCSFTPEARKKYFVYVKDEYGNFLVTPLPLVKSTGIGFSVIENKDTITCRLRFSGIEGNGNGYSVLGQVQHQVVYHASFKKTTDDLEIKIPAAALENGVLHLTVFDPIMQPVAERLLFLNHEKLNFESPDLSSLSASAGARLKTEVDLPIDSISWLTYAVSVADAAIPSTVTEENILSAVWLTTDLVNPVQQPAYYFTDTNKNKTEALDAILISEKWQRFNWNEIINNKFPVVNHRSLNYLTYTGKVMKGTKLRPNEEVNLFLYFPDSSSQIILAKTDSAGNIEIDNIAFRDEIKIFYQLNTKKYGAKLIDIKFENNNRFFPYSLALPITPYQLSIPAADATISAWMTRVAENMKMEKTISDKYKTLQEVVVKAKLKTAKEQLNEKLTSGLFRSLSETVFDFINEDQGAMGYINILDWLQGRVAGLNIEMEEGQYVPYIRGSRAAMYIDEMASDALQVSSLNVNDIAMVKVIKMPLMLGIGTGNGAIAIYTARGNMRPLKREPSLPNNKIKGYDSVKKNFIPDYENKSVPQPDTDTRDQLLWQTILPPITASDKTKTSFFNNDQTKRFRIIVQGFTEKGFPVFIEKIIEAAIKAF
jgi:hypothetical protein